MDRPTVGVEEIADRYAVLGGYLLVKRGAPLVESAGGIALPEQLQAPGDDYTVLAAGPDAVRAGWGPGDILVAPARSIARLEDAQDGAFVLHTDAYARRRFYEDAGTDWGEWEAMGARLLVQPHRELLGDEDGMRGTVSEGGVIVAAHVLRGMASRQLERGEDLYKQLVEIVRSPAYLAEPTDFYRHKHIHRFMERLSPWEQEAVYEYQDRVQKRKQKNWGAMQTAPARYPYRWGTVLGAGPDCRQVQGGARVWFEKDYSYLFVAPEGESAVIVVPEGNICAVEEGS